VTGEGVITPFDFTTDKLSKVDSSAENYENEDPTLTLENRYNRCIQLCSGDEPPPQSLLKNAIEQNESTNFSDRDGADEKIDLPQFSFPEGDFKFLTW